MALKARLHGRDDDLALLSGALPTGDTRVARDEDGYYLTSATVEHRPSHIDYHPKATEALARVNGIGWITSPNFHPVKLTGIYHDGDRQHVVVSPTSITSTGGVGIPTVGGDAVATNPSTPRGPAWAAAAAGNAGLAEALAILGRTADPGWVELYKVWEIIGDGRDPKQLGWVTEADKEAFKQAANHPAISGDAARHARMPGRPRRVSPLSLPDGRAFIRRLMETWLDSLQR
ncbi:hypothetical protein [Frankia sp. AiPa1]|uniref:hypothetical protein n=1 Tax=Frankia sp. AiPa1 TaxID=573492 RepID=UPI00202B4EBE|nr:hypothetical protein [Frankia sp. AiPa1]MCL9762969.1 hypothetical protein [Frankia sp. AiPa1]